MHAMESYLSMAHCRLGTRGIPHIVLGLILLVRIRSGRSKGLAMSIGQQEVSQLIMIGAYRTVRAIRPGLRNRAVVARWYTRVPTVGDEIAAPEVAHIV